MELSHFYTQKEALSFDTEDVFCAEEQAHSFASRLGADTVKALRHTTSRDVTGDYSRVVGYGAAVALKAK